MNAIMISYIDVLCDKKSIYKRLSLFVLTFCALFYGVFFVFLIKKTAATNQDLICGCRVLYRQSVCINNSLNLTFGFPTSPHKTCLSYVPHDVEKWKNLREME